MRLWIRATVFAFFISSSPTIAADEHPSTDLLPLGFDTILWGMSPQQVQSVFPSLTTSTAVQGQPLTNQVPRYIEAYQYAGCTFHVTLYFSQERLSSVDFQTRDQVNVCRAKIEQALIIQYSTPSSSFQDGPDFSHMDWSRPSLKVFYNLQYGLLEILTLQSNGPPFIIYN